MVAITAVFVAVGVFGALTWLVMAIPMLKAPRTSLITELVRASALTFGPAIAWTGIVVMTPWPALDELPFVLVPTEVVVIGAPTALAYLAALAFRMTRTEKDDGDAADGEAAGDRESASSSP